MIPSSSGLYKILENYLGWCPNGHSMNAKNRDGAGSVFLAGSPVVKNPGPSGVDRAGIPSGGRYEHTQRGTLIIGAVSAAIILILTTMYLFGIVWVSVLVLGIMAFVLTICSTLTVSADADILRLRFGPIGLIQKSWPISEIVSVTTVINPWYYGWGIRWTPHGSLYNVSGRHAVEILLFSGKTFRIGTDEPEALKTAIEQAREKKSPA